jgi:flagellar assembly factor FliW
MEKAEKIIIIVTFRCRKFNLSTNYQVAIIVHNKKKNFFNQILLTIALLAGII